jgi:nucleoside-triphosphatase
MPRNLFITGLPKTGKTTLLLTIIKELRSRGLYVGGFISPDESRSGKRTGFMVQDIESGKTDMLAMMDSDGPKVSKYHVDIGSFETIAMMSLTDFQRYDVIIIDEIGPMETKSSVFLDALDAVLDSSTPLIASLHEDLVDRFAPLGTVFEIGQDNRQQVYKDILDQIATIPKKKAQMEMRPKAPTKAKKAPAIQSKKTKAPAKKRKPAKSPKRVAKKPAKRKPANRGKKQKAAPAKKSEKEKPTLGKALDAEKPAHHKRGVVHKIKDLLGF